MVPDLASVVRKRYRMRRTLRFIALMLVLCFALTGSLDIVQHFMARFEDLRWRDALNHTPWLVGAAFLLLTERWTVPWLLPLARSNCPKCSYSLDQLADAICPECGLSIEGLAATHSPGT